MGNPQVWRPLRCPCHGGLHPTVYPRAHSGGLRGPRGLGAVPCPWASQTPHRFLPHGCTDRGVAFYFPCGAMPLHPTPRQPPPAGSGRAPAAESCEHSLCTPGRGPHSVCWRGRACTSGREVSWVPVLDTHPQAGARHRQGCRVASGNPMPFGGEMRAHQQGMVIWKGQQSGASSVGVRGQC